MDYNVDGLVRCMYIYQGTVNTRRWCHTESGRKFLNRAGGSWFSVVQRSSAWFSVVGSAGVSSWRERRPGGTAFHCHCRYPCVKPTSGHTAVHILCAEAAPPPPAGSKIRVGILTTVTQYTSPKLNRNIAGLVVSGGAE